MCNTRMKRLAVIISVGLLSATGLSCRKTEVRTESPSTVKVSIETITPTEVPDVYEASGTIRSKTATVISSRMMGSILAIHVREGDRVRAGQTLIEIDGRDLAAQFQRTQAGKREAENALEEIDRNIRAAESSKAAAEANRALAASTLNRYKTLFERRSVSPQEFDQVQTRSRVADAEAERADGMLSSLSARRNQILARIDQAKADVAGAQVSAGYARITSPVDGIVIARQAEVGSMAVPGAPILTLEDDSHYRLETPIEESQIAGIHTGQEVDVRIAVLGDEPLSGRVIEIVPAADPASRTQTVKIDLPSRPQLRSGLYGKARFEIGHRKALTLPQRSVIERGQLVSVFVVDETGTAHTRLIKTGKPLGDRIEVLSGLTDGERIIVDPAAVADGSRVDSI